jgi:ribosome-binding factor A
VADKSFSRKDRVVEQIRREVAELIRSELKDPRVGMVSLTAVELSADYAHAKVYFSTLASAEQRVAVQEGLDTASGFLRRELGRRIRIHTIPHLHFVFDRSLEHGADLSKLIDEAAALSDQTPPDPDPDADSGSDHRSESDPS